MNAEKLFFRIFAVCCFVGLAYVMWSVPSATKLAAEAITKAMADCDKGDSEACKYLATLPRVPKG
jgi:hypothetical protein